MGFIQLLIDKSEVVDDIESKISELTPKFSETVVDVTDIYKFNMQDNTPVRTGEMQRNVTEEITGQFDRLTYSDVPQWDWVIKGTPPHLILPKHPKEALYWPGADHPVASVNHPGTSPNDFPSDTFDSSEGQVDSRLQELIDWLGG
jgi:hypothetical protein